MLRLKLIHVNKRGTYVSQVILEVIDKSPCVKQQNTKVRIAYIVLEMLCRSDTSSELS